MADNTISQDDIDSLLQELQGGGSPASPAAGKDKLEEQNISSDDVEALLSGSFGGSADPAPAAEKPSPAMVAKEEDLLGGDFADPPEPPAQSQAPANPPPAAEGEDDHFANYDFSNLAMNPAEPGGTAGLQAGPALKAAPMQALGSEESAALGAELRIIRQILREQQDRSQAGSGKVLQIIILIVVLLGAGASGINAYLTFRIASGVDVGRSHATKAAAEPQKIVEVSADAEGEKPKPDAGAAPVQDASQDKIGEVIAKEAAQGAAPAAAEEKGTVPIPPAAEEAAGEAPKQVELARSFLYKGFALKQRKGFTDLVFTLDGDLPDEYIKTIELPKKLVVDLLQTKPVNKKWQAKLNHANLDKIRMGIQPGNTLRLVIEFKKDALPEFTIDTPDDLKAVVVSVKD